MMLAGAHSCIECLLYKKSLATRLKLKLLLCKQWRALILYYNLENKCPLEMIHFSMISIAVPARYPAPANILWLKKGAPGTCCSIAPEALGPNIAITVISRNADNPDCKRSIPVTTAVTAGATSWYNVRVIIERLVCIIDYLLSEIKAPPKNPNSNAYASNDPNCVANVHPMKQVIELAKP